jgi:hypothetical protein
MRGASGKPRPCVVRGEPPPLLLLRWARRIEVVEEEEVGSLLQF